MSDPSPSPPQNPDPAPVLDLAPPHPVQRNYNAAATSDSIRCGYCSALLDPFYYFCLRCGAPYKPPESTVGPARPMPMTDAQRIARLAPHAWTVFWTYAAVVIGSAFLARIFQSSNAGPSPLDYFLATLAVFVTTLVFTFIHWRPLAAQLKTSGFLKWEAWAGLAALAPLLLVNYAIAAFAHAYFKNGAANPAQGIPLPAAILIICVFPAITEEIAFRGLLQYWLELAITPAKALMLGSALFAGLHFSIISFPYLFAVGALLAIVRRRTGSLYPGMLIHFLHNLVVITCFRF